MSSSYVRGLFGDNDATYPGSKFALQAAVVCVRNRSTGDTVEIINPTSITMDMDVEGAGGRDQSSAFTTPSWVRAYYIYNPTTQTLSAIMSAAAPSVGPTLPSGYTHDAYATTLRKTGDGTLRRDIVRGHRTFHANGMLAQPLNESPSSMGATSNTAVDYSGAVPPEAVTGLWRIHPRVISSSGGGGENTATIQLIQGLDFGHFRANVEAANTPLTAMGYMVELPNLGTLWYRNSAGGSVSAINLSLFISGFGISNGDS